MSRYIKQKTKYDCGPVALLNALIWSNNKVTYDTHFDLCCKYLKYVEKEGTNPTNFDKVIKRKKLPFYLTEIIEIPSIDELKTNLDKNNIIILGIDGDVTHVGLLLKINKTHATLVNWYGQKAINRVTIRTLKRYISKWCIAYCIRRKYETE